MNIKPQTLDTSNKNFNEKFISRLRINSSTNKKIQSLVNTIIANIKKRGDTSLISYVKKYDGYNLKNIKDIFIICFASHAEVNVSTGSPVTNCRLRHKGNKHSIFFCYLFQKNS